MLCEPKLHRIYVVCEKGVPVFHVELLKALNGLLREALLFYYKFIKDLESQGFKLNLYNTYIENKMVNSKQLTVVCNVDDTNI